MSGNPLQVTGDLWVRISDPCVGTHEPSRHQSHGCQFMSDTNHAHLVLSCEDGVGIVPFPIQSSEGLTALLEKMVNRNLLSAKEARAIVALDLAKKLRGTLTVQETSVLQDPVKLSSALAFSFAGY